MSISVGSQLGSYDIRMAEKVGPVGRILHALFGHERQFTVKRRGVRYRVGVCYRTERDELTITGRPER